MNRIRIGERSIGEGQSCFLVAEAGINHNGRVELGHELIDAAVAAGADAIKFQNYRTDEFLSDNGLTYSYMFQGQEIQQSQWQMFKRCELPASAFRELKKHCDEAGIVFFSTPMSEAGVAVMVELGVELLKNGSDCLTHLPLLRSIARTGLPTVISTGMATELEVADAVAAFKAAGGSEFLLLHCVSCYPAAPCEMNLNRMVSLRTRFNCLTGFSDHSAGGLAAAGAVALGACMIEKHFTLDKSLEGPDHSFSADPKEFQALVEDVRAMEMMLGDGDLVPAEAEREARLSFRLSLAAKRNLEAGHKLMTTDIVFRRPGTGIPPAQLEEFSGRPLKRAVLAGGLLMPEDF